MNRLKNRIIRLLLIDDAEPIGINDAELKKMDAEMHISDYLDQAEEIYEAALEDIIDAIKHSSVCQHENCENKLYTLFKIFLTILRYLIDVNELESVLP